MTLKVSFNDLKKQYLDLKKEIDFVIKDTIKNSFFIRGPYVEKFEQDFAKIIGVNHCVSVGNGTDALYIAMKAMGLQTGDEVIVPAHSWISTSETVTQASGKVIFCDTDKDTFTIDPKHIEKNITSRTVGIIPVHLYGQPADMESIIKIAKKHNLWVIEDCAQAHLANYKGKIVGTFGDAATFSFYPGKNLGAMGDAGAIVTNNIKIADKATMYARHGGLKKGDHQIEGINSRMDGIQAAILSVKLPYLLRWTNKRQKVAEIYSNQLKEIKDLKVPKVAKGREHVWHLYVIKHDDRDELAKYLLNNGIQTAINYPIALPFLPAYKKYKLRAEDFPNAYLNQSQIISLPIYPEMEKKKVNYVVNKIREFKK